jgi:uncharacterized protein YbaP (TraB family)
MQCHCNTYDGYLYKINDNQTGKTKGFLCGTIHLVEAEGFQLHRRIIEAFNASKCLAVELDPQAHAFAMQIILLRSPLYIQYASALSREIASFNTVGVDTTLLSMAKAKKLPVIELETVKKQIEACMLAAQRWELKKNEPSNFVEVCEQLISAYKRGCKAELVMTFSLNNNEEYKKSLIYDRNIGMASKIHELLLKDELPFIAVGSAHLYRESKEKTSLISALRSKGWSVTRILENESQDLTSTFVGK